MNNLRVVLFLAALILVAVADCQSGPDIANTKQRFLNLKPSAFANNGKIPFKRIEILDYRFDTTKVGYASNKFDSRLLIKDGVGNSLGNYLNHYFKNNLDNSSSRTLLIVLKKFWLQYGITNQLLKTKRTDFSLVSNFLPKNSICLASMDVFAETEQGYKGLTRLASTFSADEKSDDISVLLLPFDSLMQNLVSLDLQSILAQKRNFARSEIQSNYQSRLNIPILNGALKRGIYLTFDDFKNNKISYPDFSYKESKHSTDVMIKENGKDVAFIDYWGFFNGHDLFIKFGLTPFKAIRQGNSFDLYADLRNENYNYPIYTQNQMALLTLDKRYTFLPSYPLQVDMENGELY